MMSIVIVATGLEWQLIRDRLAGSVSVWTNPRTQAIVATGVDRINDALAGLGAEQADNDITVEVDVPTAHAILDVAGDIPTGVTS